MGLGIGSGRGGRRAGGGRPKGVKTRWPPEIAAELRRLADDLKRLHEYRRTEHEAFGAHFASPCGDRTDPLGLREKIEVPKASWRRPLEA
jgi:hypothetical protein